MLNGSPSMLRYANVLSLTARSMCPGHGLFVWAPGYLSPNSRSSSNALSDAKAFFFAMDRVYVAGVPRPTVAESTSQAMTQGIRVSVQSTYLPEQSSPPDDRFVFAYTITIANESTFTAQ